MTREQHPETIEKVAEIQDLVLEMQGSMNQIQGTLTPMRGITNNFQLQLTTIKAKIAELRQPPRPTASLIQNSASTPTTTLSPVSLMSPVSLVVAAPVPLVTVAPNPAAHVVVAPRPRKAPAPSRVDIFFTHPMFNDKASFSLSTKVSVSACQYVLSLNIADIGMGVQPCLTSTDVKTWNVY